MRKTIFSLTLLLLASNSYALFGEKELSKEEDILEVGVCEKDELESGKKSRKKVIHWVVLDHRTGAITTELPQGPHDTLRVSIANVKTYNEVSRMQDYFEVRYTLKVKKYVTRETAERSWIFWTDDSTKKKTSKNEVDELTYTGYKDAEGNKSAQAVQMKTADFEAKTSCEQSRAELIDKLSTNDNPAINTSSRSEVKEVPVRTTTKKPVKASEQ